MALTMLFVSMSALAAKTEVINPSTDCCADDWSWTGDSDKIASLPSGEITTEQIYVAAICTPYWTDNKYGTEATLTEVAFTSGEGLVTIALRTRNEDVIWGGADVVWAEITPTAAGEAITADTTVSGTFQMFYASWGTFCNVPFSIVLKAPEQAPSTDPAETNPAETQPAETNPAETQPAGTEGGAETGDNGILLWLALAAVGACGIVVLTKKKFSAKAE
jgi:hypothetical protein